MVWLNAKDMDPSLKHNETSIHIWLYLYILLTNICLWINIYYIIYICNIYIYKLTMKSINIYIYKDIGYKSKWIKEIMIFLILYKKECL